LNQGTTHISGHGSTSGERNYNRKL
jgi:hypothetical protein